MTKEEIEMKKLNCFNSWKLCLFTDDNGFRKTLIKCKKVKSILNEKGTS